jgi:hypothetical protein
MRTISPKQVLTSTTGRFLPSAPARAPCVWYATTSSGSVVPQSSLNSETLKCWIAASAVVVMVVWQDGGRAGPVSRDLRRRGCARVIGQASTLPCEVDGDSVSWPTIAAEVLRVLCSRVLRWKRAGESNLAVTSLHRFGPDRPVCKRTSANET